MLMKIKGNKKLLIPFLLVIFSVIYFPFFVEKVLTEEKVQIFNLSTSFSAEVWFGFIASYLGAIGAVVLGGIALYQNKIYKELSDQSGEEIKNLQTEIKNLNKRSVELIEINTKLEKSKYYPQLSEHSFPQWNGKLKKEDLKNTFQITVGVPYSSDIYTFLASDPTPSGLFEKFDTFTYVLKNEGEKVIRNLRCIGIYEKGERISHIWSHASCDVDPGKEVYLVYATEWNLRERIINGNVDTLDFEYEMENVIGEKFSMKCKVTFYIDDQEIKHIEVDISVVTRLED